MSSRTCLHLRESECVQRASVCTHAHDGEREVGEGQVELAGWNTEHKKDRAAGFKSTRAGAERSRVKGKWKARRMGNDGAPVGNTWST